MKQFLLAAIILFPLAVNAKTLKVMDYNIENLFDIKHDVGTEDYTYLPLSVKKTLPGHKKACEEMSGDFRKNECLNLDWTEAKFTKKILNISKVVKAFDETGKGPDILVLQEVENSNVLNKLVTKGLDKLGFAHQVLIEGDDTRGIDVAVISKFPVISSKRHPLIINGTKLDTRGILEVTLNVEGTTVVVFANHWPSQSNPASERAASAKLLSDVASKLDADLIIAAGDFNTIDADAPYPFDNLKGFIDAEAEARKLGVNLKPGTHFFKGGWTSLDRLFVFEDANLKAQYEKFQIINKPFMMRVDSRTGESIPARSEHSTGEGFSDHLPLGMEFTY
jgi:endonuclease/exonuclease/phosphatase family metal-dependent hydrolase